MIDVRIRAADRTPEVLAVGVGAAGLQLEGIATHVLPIAARSVLAAFEDESSPSAKAGDVCEVTLPGELPTRLLVAGLGDATAGDARRAGAALARTAKAESLAVAMPGLSPDALTGLTEGLALGDHRFAVKSAPSTGRLRSVSLVAVDDGAADDGAVDDGAAGDGAADELAADGAAAVERGLLFARATVWARDLSNNPASSKTPAWLAEQAVRELTPLRVQVGVRDENWLVEHGFGGVLAVGRASASPPRLIEASWRPRGTAASPHVVIVGKGITFDTGGLNIKPGDSMRSMHTDMAGGAAALGALRAVAELRVPLRVTVLVPVAENALSGSAMRPGDVIRHYGGRTTEVLNTDAEGRLALADALAYARARLHPSVLVDIATLTGAMKVALGLRTAGVFATSDELASSLTAAGEEADEPLWRMPFTDDYERLLESDIADAQNAPGNPGAITAALFLRPFVADLPWAHLDIAGPARATADSGVATRGATGFGARLLARWVESYAAR